MHHRNQQRTQGTASIFCEVITACGDSDDHATAESESQGIAQQPSSLSSRAKRERNDSMPLTEMRRLTRIISLQVTLSPPTQHAGTLEFYRDDYRAYELSSDRDGDGLVEHYLLWIVPHTQDDRATPHLALRCPDFKGQRVMAVDVRDNVGVFQIDM